MLFAVLLVVAGVLSADCVNIQQHADMPNPVEHFDALKYGGLWYMYATTQPCSWNGATAFTDWTANYVVKSDKHFEFDDTYRYDGSCVSIKAKIESVYPGVFAVKDSIGGVFSGRVIVVCIDYHKYVLTWGCVKMAMGGKRCVDGWVTVKTRHPRPSQKVRAEIDDKLQALWGITAREIGLVKHDNPCVQPKKSRRRMKLY